MEFLDSFVRPRFTILYKVRESVIEKYLRTEISRRIPGSQIHKYTPRRSEPDRIILLSGGVAIFVETKRPGKKLRPEQERAFSRLKKLGFRVECLDTKNKIDLFILEVSIV